MSIIDKLGIKPIKWKKEIVNCHKCGQAHEMSTFTNGDVTDIEAMRNEMLEALISWCAWVEDSGDYEAEPNFVSVIEKACHPLKWEEIKRLIK